MTAGDEQASAVMEKSGIPIESGAREVDPTSNTTSETHLASTDDNDNHVVVSAMEKRAIEYMAKLAADPANQPIESSWYCIAVSPALSPRPIPFWRGVKKLTCALPTVHASAFAACNQGKLVAHVYRTAIAPYMNTNDVDQRRLVLRRIKESLLTTSFVSGLPRCINAVRALIAALPDAASNERCSPRRGVSNGYVHAARGEAYMRNVFGADFEPFVAAMDEYCPDLRALVVDHAYGLYQSELAVLDAVTTSQINIAALLAMDVPTEVGWHMRGILRNGGTVEQMGVALEMARHVCAITEVVLRNPVPRVEDVVDQERLF